MLILCFIIFSCSSDSSPTGPTNGTCSDIIGEWDGVNQVNDVLNEDSCPLDDSTQDISMMNWGFESDGEVEKNTTGGFTNVEYYECQTDTEVMICTQQTMSPPCINYTVSVVPNQSLELSWLNNNDPYCNVTETLYFIPEAD